MKQYGLLGENIHYSMSPMLHRHVFQLLDVNADYELYDLPKHLFKADHLRKTLNHLDGFNVTIPYKEAIIPFLDELDDDARKIGAVNTVINCSGKWTGYNTDVDGFRYALSQIKAAPIQTACVLGTGGASKMVCAVLKELGISYHVLSRRAGFDLMTYADFESSSASLDLLINCTPVGSQQLKNELPIDPRSIKRFKAVYDLVYTPAETPLLKIAKEQGLDTLNGMTMLIVQALKAEALWLDKIIEVDHLVPQLTELFK